MTPNQAIVAKLKADLEASKGGNVPGITEDHRHEMVNQLAQVPVAPRPFFCKGSPAMVQLEGMVDRVGIRNVLYALASICDAKVNWQDHVAARIWEERAFRVGKTAGGMSA